jgi:ATP-dependent DNA ligase
MEQIIDKEILEKIVYGHRDFIVRVRLPHGKIEQWKQKGYFRRLGHGIWKLKRELTEDVYCTGEYEVSTSDTNLNLEYEINGVRKRGVFKNLICYQLMDTAPFVNRPIRVCDVGTGFSQTDRKTIQAMLDLGQITKEKPLILEVKANGRHESGKLRHPTFTCIRTDKPWNECVMKGVQ